MPSLTLPAEAASLTGLMAFVSQAAEAARLNSDRIKTVELATEEAMVNVIQHAYPKTSGTVRIDCRVDPHGRFVVATTDNGIPFNGLDFPDPDLDADLMSRNVGGLGVFLIKKMADQCHYRREDDQNILTLVFDPPASDEPRSCRHKPFE